MILRKKLLLLVLFALTLTLFSTQVEADLYEQKHLTLLAVQEVSNGDFVGSTADLYLELIDGSGRVFLDTSPVTKIDTQISTRYAKDIACDYFDLECDYYDFIYTIRAESSIIGGPSAGAAVAALTAITMLDLEYNESVTITGTVNSGGIIGPVGGVREKVFAAQDNNISRVLLSLGSSELMLSDNFFEDSNVITNITNNSLTSNELEIDLVEVVDLNDVVYELTSMELVSDNYQLEVNNEYNSIMQNLSQLLCDRSVELEEELFDFGFDNNSLAWSEIEEWKNLSENSWEIGDYYSAASFCFALNVEMSHKMYQLQGLTLSQIDEEVDQVKENSKLIENSINSTEIETISDLQAMMVVKERLNEMNDLLEKIDTYSSDEDKLYYLAFAKERLYSALAWMHFFNMEGKNFLLSDDVLRATCYQKIAEGEERYEYAKLYLLGLDFENIKDRLDLSLKSLNEGDYYLCLSQASQAKAEASTILNSLGLTEDNLYSYLDAKVTAVEREIAENTVEGVFPILGYSYYQYAKTLEGEDPYASLLYYELALELSELAVYFPSEEDSNFLSDFHYNQHVKTFLNGIIQGIIIGVLFTWLIFQIAKRRKRLGK